MRKKKPLRLDDDAAAEIQGATDYYEREREGLGQAFQAALLATFDQIAAFPAAFAPVVTTRGGLVVRRALVHPFSYKIVYVELPDGLHVVALAHVKRRPE